MADDLTALNASNVRFVYGGARSRAAHVAVDGVNLALARGTMTALLGPNGSGKSTLLRIIGGLLTPDAGEIAVFGHQVGQSSRARTGVVFQSNGLDPFLTVLENLRCQAALYGLTRSTTNQRIQRELAKAGLESRAHERIRTLSGGLARRVDLCRALLNHPALLLLDEPTVGLDPSARDAFLSEVASRRADGVTVLLTTHLLDEAEQCDRVVLMHRGRIVADGAPKDLRRGIGESLLRLLDGAPPPALATLPWSERRGERVLSLPGESARIQEAARTLIALGRSFAVSPPTLADVFEQLTGDSLNGGNENPAGVAA